jgi:hypothetical protein
MIHKLIRNTKLTSEYESGVSLRSVEHNPASSNDSHHFSAQVHLDGERIMKVGNDGRGGNHYYTPRKICTPVITKDLVRRSYLFCKRARKEVYHQINKDSCDNFAFVDVLVSNLLNEHLTRESMRKALRNRIHIIDLDRDKPLLYETNKRPTPIHLANSKKALDGIGKHFNYILLNELDETSQLKLWLTIN